MSKKRMIAGFNLKQSGVLAPGEPIVLTSNIPKDCDPVCVRIDTNGNFVLFCEVWSHPEGTTVNHEEEEFLIAPSNTEIRGSWEYWDTLVAGTQLFHLFRQTKLTLHGI